MVDLLSLTMPNLISFLQTENPEEITNYLLEQTRNDKNLTKNELLSIAMIAMIILQLNELSHQSKISNEINSIIEKKVRIRKRRKR